jgi:hypothetical protein
VVRSRRRYTAAREDLVKRRIEDGGRGCVRGERCSGCVVRKAVESMQLSTLADRRGVSTLANRCNVAGECYKYREGTKAVRSRLLVMDAACYIKPPPMLIYGAIRRVIYLFFHLLCSCALPSLTNKTLPPDFSRVFLCSVGAAGAKDRPSRPPASHSDRRCS